jgi:hypothetical protein
MKRITTLILLDFITTAGIKVQSFRIGIKAGGNLTKIDGESFYRGFLLAYQLGGFAVIDFNKKWGIQPEVLWSQSAAKSATFNTIFLPDQDIKLDYLSIPLLLRYNIGNLVTLNARPQYSILFNKNHNLLQNCQNAFTSDDFAMVGGLQLNFKYLRVYGRYVIALNNLNDINNQNNWKSQQLQLGIGLRF